MIYLALTLLCVILIGVSQILFKVGSGGGRSAFRMYANLPTMTGYLLCFIETICSIYAMRGIELKLFYAMASSLCYVMVLFLSVTVLKEKINMSKLLAVLLIVSGLVIFNL